MATLLANGDIRMQCSVTSEDGGLIGSSYEDVSPDDPEYEKCLIWLSDNDMKRAETYLKRSKSARQLNSVEAQIVSCHVMIDKPNHRRGFGFVDSVRETEDVVSTPTKPNE